MAAAPVRRFDSRTINLIGLGIGIVSAIVVVLAAPGHGDPSVFLTIADPIASGAVPYREFKVEYPPLALLPLVLPRVLVGVDAPPMAYEIVFGLVNLITAVLSGAVVAWLARRGWSAESERDSLIMFLALAFALSVLVVFRFDIVPAFLSIAAVAAVAAGRSAWAGFALGLAVATKLYPAFLAPVLLAYYLCGKRRSSAGYFVFGLIATISAVMLQSYLIAGPDALSFLNYQRDRGVEIESVVGGLALLADNLFGINAVVSFGFGSFEVESRVVDALAGPAFIGELVLGFTLLVAGGYAFIGDARTYGQVQQRTLITYIVATLVVVMLANKVLSPQYLAWLLPFGALLPHRQAFLLLIVCVLTTIVYPIGFDFLRAADPMMVAVLNLRNLLLFVLFAWLVVPRRDSGVQVQSVAMFETPPTRPALTPNTRSPIASRRLRCAITVIKKTANATVTTLATVKPGMPISSARMTTTGFASADMP